MGALGRCGRGAVDLLLKAGLPEENITKWDIQETRERPGPYPEILESDVSLDLESICPSIVQLLTLFFLPDLRQLHLPFRPHSSLHRAHSAQLRITQAVGRL